jgi:hypothetical protein
MVPWARGRGALAPLCLTLVLTLSGCATGFSPTPIDQVPFKSRSQSQTSGGITVTAAVPTDEEAAAIYGVDLASKEIQPVWIEIENRENEAVWLLTAGVDPAYFSAGEAAYAFSRGDGRLTEHFKKLQFENPVDPGTTVSGYLLVNRDEGYKSLDIDLMGLDDIKSFTYIIRDPSFKGDYTLVDFETLYSGGEIVHIDDIETLRRTLEQLPCCTTNKDGSERGDPLNLVLVGDANDIFPALIRRRWHGAEIIWSKSLLRTLESFLQGSRYRYSPVSPLYVFGRQQDLAAQKARGTIHERNHLRLWLTPYRFKGQTVWIGQISRDIGVKFTLKSPTISTHVIDPDVDEARRYLLEDLAYSQSLAAIAHVGGVGIVTEEAPQVNLVGDPWFSDGRRAVMFFEPRPRALSEVHFLSWEAPLE